MPNSANTETYERAVEYIEEHAQAGTIADNAHEEERDIIMTALILYGVAKAGRGMSVDTWNTLYKMAERIRNADSLDPLGNFRWVTDGEAIGVALTERARDGVDVSSEDSE